MSAARWTIFSADKAGNMRDHATGNDPGMVVRFAERLRNRLGKGYCVGILDNEDGTEVSETLEQGL